MVFLQNNKKLVLPNSEHSLKTVVYLLITANHLQLR